MYVYTFGGGQLSVDLALQIYLCMKRLQMAISMWSQAYSVSGWNFWLYRAVKRLTHYSGTIKMCDVFDLSAYMPVCTIWRYTNNFSVYGKSTLDVW